MTNSVSFVSVNRWSRCLWCGTIYQAQDMQRWTHINGNQALSYDDGHWCGAPWQSHPRDMPREWVPGEWDEIARHYPESPFAEQQETSIASVGVPCS